MAEIIGQQDNYGAVQVVGLTEFIKDIRQANNKGLVDAKIREANERVAQVVIRMARALADTKQERRAASTLETSSSVQKVEVRMGGRSAPYAGGANFGAKIDQRRLIKAPNQRGGRGRATIVRQGESILKVATRVESQFVSRSGRTVSAFEGGTRVQLARTAAGGLKVIRGWNNFRAKGQQPTQWRKGKDEFLYAAVTRTQTQISESYQRFIDETIGKPFSDKSSDSAA